MKYDVKKSSELKRSIEIRVEKEDLAGIRKKILDEINKDASVPGFRKGKAPLDLIEKKFPDLVKERLMKEAIPGRMMREDTQLI